MIRDTKGEMIIARSKMRNMASPLLVECEVVLLELRTVAALGIKMLEVEEYTTKRNYCDAGKLSV